jgi:hypothetical protein
MAENWRDRPEIFGIIIMEEYVRKTIQMSKM